jgi:hypothetical protein
LERELTRTLVAIPATPDAKGPSRRSRLAPVPPEPPQDAAPPAPAPKESDARTRLIAACTLFGVIFGVGYVATTCYHAFADSFVTPMILSPDSELVLQNKLKLSELAVERARSVGELTGIGAELDAVERAKARLSQLQQLAVSNPAHGSAARPVHASPLLQEKTLLAMMRSRQEELAKQARRDLSAGIISRSNYGKEIQSLDQMTLALIENRRTTEQSEISSEDQSVRIDLELLRLDAERSAKAASKKVLEERIAIIDTLVAQLKERPIARAIEKSVAVAFVPYTQIDGVTPRADVLECVWGLFLCKSVGSVVEIVPGEVTMPDPWGNPTRGQYAVLDLRHEGAAKAKVLRVRKTRSVPDGLPYVVEKPEGAS